jgi:cell division protein ZapB
LLTRREGGNIVSIECTWASKMSQEKIEQIEQKVDRLITLCYRLQKENQALRERESGLLREKSLLVDKNEQARQRVEGMISRFKNLTSEG